VILLLVFACSWLYASVVPQVICPQNPFTG
jgi:hypothetical protein